MTDSMDPGQAAEGLSAALNLDTLEREGETPQPYAFILGGKRYMLSDPKDIDWQQLIMALMDPFLFFRLTMPPEDHEKFFSTPIPTWKINAMITGYQKHYGIPTPGELGALPR
jgi:hypothetical protein